LDGPVTRLTWPGCTNVRDLGGLPAAGGRIRERALVRADALTRLDPDGVAALEGYGVGRVIDLRGQAEAAAGPPHPWTGSYAHEPWADVTVDADGTLVDFYLGSLASNTARFASVVRAFVAAPPGAVVVHCAAGKDRTGLVVALLLLVAEVPRSAVVDDYVLSETELGVAAWFDVLGPREQELSRSRPETLGAALAALDGYGGVPAYLRERCGLGAGELDAVRERLVEPR
jgi:protein tyrosine/serine phosphatase